MGESAIFTLSDLAKYPFLPEAAEEIKRLNFGIENLLEPNYAPILDRAERRIIEALMINPPEVSYDPYKYDKYIELLSFPVAIIFASATSSDYIKRRFALAEARRAYNLLKVEDDEKILEIARRFGWKIKLSNIRIGLEKFDFSLNFIDYLKNISSFHEKDWKLVNRLVVKGEVYLSKQEIARLLQEEIRRHIESKMDPKVRSLLPDEIIERINSLRKSYAEKISESSFTIEDLSSSDVKIEFFPPCIRDLYGAALSGRHISHVGRFTLTAFLLNIGMDPEVIVGLFRRSADFNERMTKYQIEHIAGQRGSMTKYTPPKCDTLQTYGLCPGMNDICKKIKHPLIYYLRKKRGRKVVSGI
ncbi:MAG: DNA primase large subunit PriL [Candidatus Bathyarchaeia archaeon]